MWPPDNHDLVPRMRTYFSINYTLLSVWYSIRAELTSGWSHWGNGCRTKAVTILLTNAETCVQASHRGTHVYAVTIKSHLGLTWQWKQRERTQTHVIHAWWEKPRRQNGFGVGGLLRSRKERLHVSRRKILSNVGHAPERCCVRQVRQ